LTSAKDKPTTPDTISAEPKPKGDDDEKKSESSDSEKAESEIDDGFLE
jgi:hypothetical protein